MYDIKPDMTYKARLVCTGSRIDPCGLSTPATVIKIVSFSLLDFIADLQYIQVMCDDIINALIQANTK